MPRKTSRSLWAAKLAGCDLEAGPVALPREGQANVPPGFTRTRVPFYGLVLGIDPSLRGTGLAVLEFRPDGESSLLTSRTLRLSPKLPFAECLAEIHRAVQQALQAHPPRHTAVEQTIYVQNFQTAQILGAVRGAAIAAAAITGQSIFEYPPLRIKQAVVGFGRASKEQMIRQVASLLGLSKQLPTDEADAAAVALCHALTWRETPMLRQAGR